ncbi:hypothetical protein Bbelb_211770 [Branchiostoma belcheri]|nr:hypothetical protein Bbelb_211770 [Branchiostoma belcheri]
MKGPRQYHLYGALPGSQMKGPRKYYLYGAFGSQMKGPRKYYLRHLARTRPKCHMTEVLSFPEHYFESRAQLNWCHTDPVHMQSSSRAAPSKTTRQDVHEDFSKSTNTGVVHGI